MRDLWRCLVVLNCFLTLRDVFFLFMHIILFVCVVGGLNRGIENIEMIQPEKG